MFWVMGAAACLFLAYAVEVSYAACDVDCRSVGHWPDVLLVAGILCLIVAVVQLGRRLRGRRR